MDAKLLLTYLDRLMPFDSQEEWDRSGVVIKGKSDIRKIGICLEVEKVIDQIQSENPDAIICHHPPHYRKEKYPLKKDVLTELAEKEKWVIACHTNADFCRNGFVDEICNVIGIVNLWPIIPKGIKKRLKVVVFVPEDYVNRIVEKLSELGAGRIRFYDACSFRAPGYGTFYAVEEAEPRIGKKENLESISEVRLEFEISESLLEQVLKKVSEIHPYEEPVFETYPFLRYPKGFGLGRIGNVSTRKSLKGFFDDVKKVLSSANLLYKAKDDVKVVAICPGSGARLIENLQPYDVDVFITSDVGYHDLQNAAKKGITIIEVDHDEAEEFFVSWLSKKLEKRTEFSGVKIVRLYKEKRN